MSREGEIMSRKRGTSHAQIASRSAVAIRNTERRYRERRRRDIAEAIRAGLDGPGFDKIASSYLEPSS